jgi:hypothetical protein
MIEVIVAGAPHTEIFLKTMNPAISPRAAPASTLSIYYQVVRDEAAAKSVHRIDNSPLWERWLVGTCRLTEFTHQAQSSFDFGPERGFCALPVRCLAVEVKA